MARWNPPPFPLSSPPVEVSRHFGLPPPRYPDEEKREGIYGEVLLEVVVDGNNRLTKWRVVRATTEGYARSVLATMSDKGEAPGVSAGVYLYSVVFNGENQEHDGSRPATLWVTTDGFGQ